MKRLALIVVSLVSVALLGVAAPAGVPAMSAVVLADAGDTIIEVYPTGLHPQDSLNVQGALDTVASPGTVVMKATDPSGTPLSFNFGGDGTIGSGAVVKLLRPGITLTGDGWDSTLDEPRTKIVGGGGRFQFSPSLVGQATVFAVQSPGVTIREIKLTTTFAFTGVFISSALQQASEAPVLVERNDISVLNYAVLGVYAAAFPATIRDNVLKGLVPVSAQWAGLTLRSIATYPFDEPVPPTDESGAIVRFPLVITNNLITRTPSVSTLSFTVLLWGWANLYSENPDPEVGARRLRPNSASPWVYQYFQGDNGPIVFSGNHIVTSLQGSFNTVVGLGGGGQGLSHTVVTGNTIKGPSDVVIERFPYGHDVRIEDNDLSAAPACQQVSIDGAGVTLTGNSFGPVLPLPPEYSPPTGIPQPAVALISVNYNPGLVPVPHPVENCVIAKNDYRRTGLSAGSLLVASQQELQWTFYTTGDGTGTEVKNNLVFESGGFPVGTGGARDQILVLANMINPLTGLPYVYDNRIVGHPARWITNPGVGPQVRQMMRMRGLAGAFMGEW